MFSTRRRFWLGADGSRGERLVAATDALRAPLRNPTVVAVLDGGGREVLVGVKRIAHFLLCGLVVGCEVEPAAYGVVGTLERDRVEVVADSSEPVLELRVREGGRVAAGDLLRQEDRWVRQRTPFVCRCPIGPSARCSTVAVGRFLSA